MRHVGLAWSSRFLSDQLHCLKRPAAEHVVFFIDTRSAQLRLTVQRKYVHISLHIFLYVYIYIALFGPMRHVGLAWSSRFFSEATSIQLTVTRQ